MSFPSCRRYVKSWRYERLPSDYRDSPPQQKWIKWQIVWRIGVVVVLCAGAFCVVTRVFFPRAFSAYNPLDDYQNINPAPITVDSRVATPPSRRAVVSSLYSDGFAIAVAVLGHSTRSANVSARLLLPYLENQVSEKALCLTRAVGWEPYTVPLIPPPHGGSGMHPRFKDQYTKLNIWALDKKGIDSAVYMDADTLVRRNFDELFDSPFGFAAVPDVYGYGNPRRFSLTFNAGVLAFHPSSSILDNMRAALEVADYPMQEAEQAFLNLYFGGTCLRLPYVYNANLAIKSLSPTLWTRLRDEIRIVHYTVVKPFLHDAAVADSILSSVELEEVMAEGERSYYGQEVRWWRDAYERMMDDKGHEIRACYNLQ